ncbi:MAG: hypothetical protein PHC50_03540 [Candidatus Cloacimonetes bacterium]|nr:hypothetical protein [Candidatus Cloacimonadota bacterium]
MLTLGLVLGLPNSDLAEGGCGILPQKSNSGILPPFTLLTPYTSEQDFRNPE